jgi:uncharacterized protein YbjT (DUF2867 family)
MKGSDTCVQLVGVPHPSPAKARQFVEIDLRSALETFAAAKQAGVAHVVYVSVAQPAPVMLAYQAARGEAERALAASGLAHTIVRPWYVLGPGHRWPYALLPIYWLLERLPKTRDSAQRLGLVTLDQNGHGAGRRRGSARGVAHRRSPRDPPGPEGSGLHLTHTGRSFWTRRTYVCSG